MKHRKTMIVLIIGVFSFVISSVHASSIRNFLFPTRQIGGTTIVLDRIKGIYIIKPAQRELIFSATGTSSSVLATQQGTDTVIINAGYFGRDNNGFFPAGHFSYDPTPIDQTQCERDTNLCGYIFTDSLTIHENLTITKEPTISAGPIMMHESIVNKAIQQKNSHRQRKTQRTVLVQTKNGPVFVVTKGQYALDRLLAYIVKSFGRNISVINLDGGSSTTLRTDQPLFQHNGQRRLPTFFILK